MITKEMILRISRPGSPPSQARWRTLGRREVVGPGLTVAGRTEHGRMAGRLVLHSALAGDAARWDRLGDHQAAAHCRQRADVLQASEQAQALVAACQEHLGPEGSWAAYLQATEIEAVREAALALAQMTATEREQLPQPEGMRIFGGQVRLIDDPMSRVALGKGRQGELPTALLAEIHCDAVGCAVLITCEQLGSSLLQSVDAALVMAPNSQPQQLDPIDGAYAEAREQLLVLQATSAAQLPGTLARQQAQQLTEHYSEQTLAHFDLGFSAIDGGRMIMPLHDAFGHAIGYVLRAVAEEMPCPHCHQPLSPQTQQASPGRCPQCRAPSAVASWLATQVPRWTHSCGFMATGHLYNHHRLRAALNAGERTIFVCEGYSDCWSVYEAGCDAVCAYTGVRLSDWQARAVGVLARAHGATVVLVADDDRAGRRTRATNTELLKEHCPDVRALSGYGGPTDITGLLVEDGPQRVSSLLDAVAA